MQPEELKVLDPCCGSGHFLVYAFTVLMHIYTECGWSERDAAKSILENNLYGLDIDDRAGQLACFAVLMKARQYNRRILNSDIRLNVLSIQESNFMTDDFIAYCANKNPALRRDFTSIRDTFMNAKEYGSILSVPEIDYHALYERLDIISRSYADMTEIPYQQDCAEKLLPLIRQAQILSQKYDTVVTNPPFLNKMDALLKSYVESHFADYKADLFSVFIYRNFDFCKPNGYSGFMSPFVWMFIKTYEPLRLYILKEKSFVSLIQMEYSAFEEATVPICSFILKNGKPTTDGLYFKLSDFKGGMEVQKQKVLEALVNKDCGYFYTAQQDNFAKIPGMPVAYWVSDQFISGYDNPKLSELGDARSGLQTGNNDLFLKVWFEPIFSKIAFGMRSKQEYIRTAKKWTPQIKGGSYRKWYGNFEYIVNWENDGTEIRNCSSSRLNAMGNDDLFFKEGITWSHTTSSVFGARYLPAGSLFNVEAPTLFVNKAEETYYTLGFLNSCVAQKYLDASNATMHYLVGNIIKLPLAQVENHVSIDQLVQDSIDLSHNDWDAFETSWDFQQHPLLALPARREASYSQWANDRIEHLSHLSFCYNLWKEECERRFELLKANEEELNRIFIDIYGLQDELTPEVADKDVTVRRADLQRDIKSLISYAVGCMMGRYNLDKPGLNYAGGEWVPDEAATYPADRDGILPITDDEYFEDDIVSMFVRFIETVYGKATLEENLRFIADALGGAGTSREVIRSYFLNDFYKDHCTTYSVTGSGKRPIYWLFDAGKKNSFKCLIYMHRYQPDLLARMRTDYVHEQQERYRTQLTMLEDSAASASPAERVKLNKQISRLKDQALEIQKYEEKIHHLADQMIAIDLDDGVKVNYARFEDVLAKIK